MAKNRSSIVRLPVVGLLLSLMVVGFFIQLIAAWYAGEAQVMHILESRFFFSQDNWLTQPWTLLSYVFFHADFEHFFWNSLVYGYVYLVYRTAFSNRVWLLTWVLGSAVGAWVFAIANHTHFLLGSSNAIWALLGFACFHELVPFRYERTLIQVGRIAVFFALFLGQFYLSDEKVVIASHVGGFTIGMVCGIFLKLERMGMWKKLMNWITGAPKLTVERSNLRFKTDDEFNTERKLREDYLNSILEKIARSGYDSLSSKERSFLENQSEK